MREKGQVSLEFVFMIASLLMLFIIVMITANDKKLQNERAREFIDARSECLEVANAMSYAQSKGPGTAINITTYSNISVYSSGLITVTLPGKSEYSASCNFLGNYATQAHYINRTARISNVNGAISIE